jgi:hypothetical protein
MFLFVLAVWMWNAWLAMMAVKAVQIWHMQKEIEPIDVNKID